MNKTISILFVAIGLLNLYPVVGVISADQLTSLYGISIGSADLETLMRHRAVMLGLIGSFLLLAAFLDAGCTRSARAGTNSDCETPVSGDLIEWADIVLVMEKSHKTKVSKKFRPLLKNKKVSVLDIPDDFDFMDPVLIKILRNRISLYVRI